MATDSLRKTLDRIALFVAMGFGSGRLPLAPGTWGTAVGIGWFLLLWKLDCVVLGSLLGLIVAVASASMAERQLGKKDPSAVVVDELAAFPLAMLGLPVSFWYVAFAFLLFRIFDVTKPQPANWIQRLPSGWGIVADDVVAALYACLAMHLWRAIA